MRVLVVRVVNRGGWPTGKMRGNCGSRRNGRHGRHGPDDVDLSVLAAAFDALVEILVHGSEVLPELFVGLGHVCAVLDRRKLVSQVFQCIRMKLVHVALRSVSSHEQTGLCCSLA